MLSGVIKGLEKEAVPWTCKVGRVPARALLPAWDFSP